MKRAQSGDSVAALKRVAADVSLSVQRALVAREFAELTRGRLPLPFDEKAEWTLLGMLADTDNREVRAAVQPDWFFLDLHRAIAQAVLEAPAGDEQAITVGIVRRVHGSAPYVDGLVERLLTIVYTRGELARAIDRLLELRDVRELVLELERLALALRGETQTSDEVRKRLRRVLAE